MDFNKPSMSKNVGEFLVEILKSKEDVASMKRIMSGCKLQYTEANNLI